MSPRLSDFFGHYVINTKPPMNDHERTETRAGPATAAAANRRTSWRASHDGPATMGQRPQGALGCSA